LDLLVVFVAGSQAVFQPLEAGFLGLFVDVGFPDVFGGVEIVRIYQSRLGDIGLGRFCRYA